MSARHILPALLLVLPTLAPVAARAQTAVPDPALAEACGDRDDWNETAPPARIFGNTWYVGTCGISAILITSPRGHVLIDAATEGSAPKIVASIVKAGFRPQDVRWIVTSHEHFDHVGGLAELKRLTGARIAARAPAAAVLRTGQPAPDDSQFGVLKPFPAVAVERIVAGGDTVGSGDAVLTALATPAHSAGSTTWTWRSCEGRDCRTITYLDSMSSLTDDRYRFTDHPEHVAEARAVFDRIEALPCGVVLTPHPGGAALFQRLAGKAEFMRRDDCATVARWGRTMLDRQLAREAGAADAGATGK